MFSGGLSAGSGTQAQIDSVDLAFFGFELARVTPFTTTKKRLPSNQIGLRDRPFAPSRNGIDLETRALIVWNQVC